MRTTPQLTCTRTSVYVVTSDIESQSDGIGGTYSSSYTYSGLKASNLGRGLLGFAEQTVKDEQTLVEQKTVYGQEWPLTGMVLSQEKSRNGEWLNRTTNTYDEIDMGDGRKYVQIAETIEESRDLDGTVMPKVTTTYEYDGNTSDPAQMFGDVTKVTVTTEDGAAVSTKETVNTYLSPDEPNWVFGRLINAIVTSTVQDTVPNYAPAADDDYITVADDLTSGYTFNPTLNDRDANPDDQAGLTVQTTSLASLGTVTFNGAEITYTPNGTPGDDTFTYSIIDSGGLGSNTATVHVTVTDSNQAPQPQDDPSLSVPANDNQVEFDVLANDNDPDGDELTITATGGTASYGTVSIRADGKRILYTPGSVEGVDNLTYTVADPSGATETANFTVTVTAPPGGSGPDYNFPDFSDTSLLTLNGSTTTTTNFLDVVPDIELTVGSAYITQSIAIDSTTDFETNFQFHIDGGLPERGGIGDGMTFIIQGEGVSAIGELGGGLGYAINDGSGAGFVDDSVAIELDIFQNGNDPNNNHIAIALNGDKENQIADHIVGRFRF